MDKQSALKAIEMAEKTEELNPIAEEIANNKQLARDEKVTKPFFNKFKEIIEKSFDGTALIGNKILADGSFYEFAEENECQEIIDAIKAQTQLMISLKDPKDLAADDDLNDLLNEIDDDGKLRELLYNMINENGD